MATVALNPEPKSRMYYIKNRTRTRAFHESSPASGVSLERLRRALRKGRSRSFAGDETEKVAENKKTFR